MSAPLSNNEIYEILQSEIVSLKIAPGEVITEKELCKRFEVSRTPIRSVLQRLRENRFVDIVPHKSTTVTTIDLDITTQLIYERVAVETMVLRDFIHSCTPTDKEHARFRLRKMEEAAGWIGDPDRFDMDEFLRRDHMMHEVWFQATNKMILWNRITRPDADYARLMCFDVQGAGNVPDVLAEHQEVMDLIDAGATEKIEEWMTRHLYGGIRRLGSRLFSEEYKMYFKARET